MPRELISGHDISLHTLQPLLKTHHWVLPSRNKDRFLAQILSINHDVGRSVFGENCHVYDAGVSVEHLRRC